MKILVLGAGGMLGATLVPYLLQQGHQVLAHSRHGVDSSLVADLTSPHETSTLVGKAKPDTIINLAGVTDVDRCEADPTFAWLSNVRAVENIAAASRSVGAHLIHVSTDHLYNRSPASTESDACPGNQYAFTKYAGELAALAAPATILRTNFFGASRHATRRSLTDWLFTALNGASPVQVFEDVRFSPLSMATLCEMMMRAMQTRPVGIFNLGSNAGMSKADFAFVFAASLISLNTTVYVGTVPLIAASRREAATPLRMTGHLLY